MTPEEILDEVSELLDEDEEITVFPSLQGALVGWAQPWGVDGNRPTRLIYSASKCINILIDNGMTPEEASEWLSVNTEGGYLGPDTPIIMHGEVWT